MLILLQVIITVTAAEVQIVTTIIITITTIAVEAGLITLPLHGAVVLQVVPVVGEVLHPAVLLEDLPVAVEDQEVRDSEKLVQ